MGTERRERAAGICLGLAGLLSVAAGGACGGSSLAGDGGVDRGTTRDGPGGDGSLAQWRTWSFSETLNRDLDVLFMVDNSLSMAPLQQKLVANFPVFMQVLNGLPGGAPNLHLAVVSSSMGAGQNEIPQCPFDGDHGVFQSAPRGTCTSSGLKAGQNFISNVDGQTNYTGTIESVFGCIAPLGDQGCGFEQPFASVMRALGADNFDSNGIPQPPPENAGFLRPNSLLSIVFVTNEDDCSVPADSNLFDPGSRLVSDQYGPLASFRCNEYGHLCDGAPPSRLTAATYQTCVPNDEGRLLRVSDAVAQIKQLRGANPNRVLVSAIAGFPTPYGVDLAAPMVRDDPNMWPVVRHSCIQPTTGAPEFADPGVRLAALVQAFGRNGIYQSICADSFAPALQRVAEEVAIGMAGLCVDGQLMFRSGQPDCTLTEYVAVNGNPTTTAIPRCDTASGQQPCWQLLDGEATVCPGQRHLVVQRSDTPLAGAVLSLSCAPCLPTATGDDCR